jgi:cation diffusion facilitator family transporter
VGDSDPGRTADGRRRQRAATLSLVVGTLILLIKLWAAAVTGSAALFGDALESIVNVVAAVMVLLSVRWANTPADDDHPFGHGRIEALSAGIEGALLLAAAAGIAWNAIPALLERSDLESIELGLGLVASTMVVNFLVGGYLIRIGRKLRSMALRADGQHLITDALTTLVMIAGVGLVGVSGWWWLDPVAALGLAVWVAFSGGRVVLDAGRLLMNAQSHDDVARLAEHLAAADISAARDPHGLRILHGGRVRFVYLEVFAPPGWSLDRANALARRIEAVICETFDGDVNADVKVVPAPDGPAADSGTRWEADPEALTRGR